ncbi:hypothetical protein ACOMHN_028811 [Nucella lapillus]
MNECASSKRTCLQNLQSTVKTDQDCCGGTVTHQQYRGDKPRLLWWHCDTSTVPWRQTKTVVVALSHINSTVETDQDCCGGTVTHQQYREDRPRLLWWHCDTSTVPWRQTKTVVVALSHINSTVKTASQN